MNQFSNHIQHKIGFLGMEQLLSRAREVIDDLPESDVEYLLLESAPETQEECVQEAMEAGCEVFIARSSNAAWFSRHYQLPLVEIQISPMDFAMAIHRAKADGHRKVAVLLAQDVTNLNVPNLETLLDVQITKLVYREYSELISLIRETDCDAIVGSTTMFDITASAGKIGYDVELSAESIRAACLRAAEIARDLRESSKNREIMKAVMNNTQLGILVTDETDRVVLFNRSAQRHTGLSAAQIRGHHIEEFFPSLSPTALHKGTVRRSDRYHLIGDTMMRCVQESVRLQGKPIAVLTTLYPEAHNRRTEQKKEPGFPTHIYHWDDITALSEPMKRLIAQGRKAASREQPTVIYGEPGCGREEIAYCIHGDSARAEFPCITIDLATIPEQDAARVLFGYDSRDGVVEGLLMSANHGSVVLRNITQAGPSATACIQQVLNERQILRPGTENAVTPDIRVFTVASPGELDSLRRDFSRQLSIQSVDCPTLRSRREDVGPLFLKYLSQLSEIPMRFSLTDEMEALLQEYSWPGNVWEMRAVSTRYVLARSEHAKMTSRLKYSLLVEAIGEDYFFRDFIARNPVLLSQPVQDREAFSAAVSALKHWLHLSNNALAEKLNISRTTLWRVLQDSN